MVTTADALSSITSGMTVLQLRDLASTVSADVGSATLLLYSGGVGPYVVDLYPGSTSWTDDALLLR